MLRRKNNCIGRKETGLGDHRLITTYDRMPPSKLCDSPAIKDTALAREYCLENLFIEMKACRAAGYIESFNGRMRASLQLIEPMGSSQRELPRFAIVRWLSRQRDSRVLTFGLEAECRSDDAPIHRIDGHL